MGVEVFRKHLYLPVLACLLLVGPRVNAQDSDHTSYFSEDRGPTASETISANSNAITGMVKFDTNIGWNFTKHFGIDVGVPFMLNTRPGLFAGTQGRLGYVSYPFVSCSYFFGCYAGVATSSRLWTGELADVYAEVHYTRTYHKYNFATNLTGDAPTASFRKGLTSGRVQWDWINHVDTNFHGFDPFVNFGLANGRMDQHFLPRPYNTNLPFRTLGYMADFEGGVQYKFWRHLTLGASVWDVLPMGPQRIYSNIVWQQPDQEILAVGGSGIPPVVVTPPPTATGVPGTFGYLVGDPNHGRYWNTAFETVGPSYITRDNGFSGTLGISPFKSMDVLIGYNRSVRYALDTVSVTLQFNANSLFRKITNY
jgi:hypothetical protein